MRIRMRTGSRPPGRRLPGIVTGEVIS
jgi:hypothetical protein